MSELQENLLDLGRGYVAKAGHRIHTGRQPGSRAAAGSPPTGYPGPSPVTLNPDKKPRWPLTSRQICQGAGTERPSLLEDEPEVRRGLEMARHRPPGPA